MKPFCPFCHRAKDLLDSQGAQLAMEPQAGRKALALHTIQSLGRGEDDYDNYAGMAVKTRERKKLERICQGGPVDLFPPRTIDARLELTDQSMVGYDLKTPYRDGTPHVVFERGGFPLHSR